MTVQRWQRVQFVERDLAYGRRLVQPVGAVVASQLSGSAPIIWDLLAAHETAEEIVSMLQQHYTDPPDVIAVGVDTALRSFEASSLVVAI